MSPIEHLVWTGTAWVGRGGGVIEPPGGVRPTNYGEYIPGPATSGLLTDVHDLEDVYPNSSGYISINNPGPYVNKLFWGRLQMQSPVKPVFTNCAGAGRSPFLFTGQDGAIKCYGSGYYHWDWIDGLLDYGLWMDDTLNRPLTASEKTQLTFERWNETAGRWAYGVHGGRGTMIRTEIKNFADLWNHVQTRLTVDDPEFTEILGCWLHKNAYYYGPLNADAPGGVGTHTDGYQTSTGGETHMKGTLIGGPRDEYGYERWPNTKALWPSGAWEASFNSGDDNHNAGWMLKNEGSVWPDPLREIRNVHLEQNFLWNCGGYSVNLAFDNTMQNDWQGRGNLFNDNYYVRRADGKYLIRPSTTANLFPNQRVIDINPDRTFNIGELIPGKNG